MAECTKPSFPNGEQAQANLRRVQKRHRAKTRTTGKHETRTYRCADCGKWHLTSQTNRRN